MWNGWFCCGVVLPPMFVWSGCSSNRASRRGMAGFDVTVASCCHRCLSRVGARRMERLDGEWLAATDVRVERLVKSSV